MQSYGRYHVIQGPRGTEIRARQTGRAVINMAAGCAVAGGGVWMLTASFGDPVFSVAVAGFGALYSTLSLLALIADTRFLISDRTLMQTGRFVSSEKRRWDLSEIEHVVVYKKTRRSGKSPSPLPWRVAVIDQQSMDFPGEFSFDSERQARAFANLLAGMLGVRVVVEDSDTAQAA